MSARELITDHLELWTGAVTTKSTAGRGGSSGKRGKIELTGIKKLRELILELAVRGKLVEQDPNDEPASVLLERIAEEKARLVKEGTIKRPKKLKQSPDGYAEPFDIPDNWRWAPIDHLAPTPLFDGDWIESKDQDPSGTIRLLQLADIGVGEFKNTSRKYINTETFRSLRCSKLNIGDILIARLPSPIGRAAIFPGLHQDCITAVDVAVLRTEGILDNNYVVYAINSTTSRNQVEAHGKGATRFRISTGNLKTILVPVPPLPEQHRIVEKVDELMALCDRMEQQAGDQLEAHEVLIDTLLDALTRSADAAKVAKNWARLAEHFDTLFTTDASIDKLKQTILQLAVMGRLVEQDPSDEPASVLLERISEEKAQLGKEGKVKKQKESSGTQDKIPQLPLPSKWSWANLGELVSVMDAGWSPACPSHPAESDAWGVLKTTAVQVMEYSEVENKKLPDNKPPKDQYEVRRGDILITRAGPKNRVGISCVVKETRPKLMISDKIIRFHLIEAGLSEEYICLCLNAGETYRHLESAKSGMAESQMNISQDKLKAAPIPLCPANEQHRIVEKVDELMALCGRLKARLSEAGETRTHLAEAVVEQAVS